MVDFRNEYQFRVVNYIPENITKLFFIHLELYEAITRKDIMKAQHVCLKSEGNLYLSGALLTFVVENDMDNVFIMLQRYGAPFNIYGDKATNLIFTTIGNRNPLLFEKLLKVGIKKNANPIPTLSSIIVEILRNGTIDFYNIFKKCFANTEFWKELVKQTLIHNVIRRKDIRFCEILITDGFGVNLKDNSGNLPVHVAARAGDSLLMKLLIKSNATFKAANDANQTPLHLAAQNGNKEVFDILKSFDVDDIKDYFGKTAEDYAFENGHYDILYVEYLSLYS